MEDTCEKNGKVKLLSKEELRRQTIWGAVVAAIGLALLFYPPAILTEIAGKFIVYFAAGLIGAGAFASNKLIVIEYVTHIKDIVISVWKKKEE